VNEWGKSGRAKKTMKRYLEKTNFVPFLGGQKIIIN